MFVAVWILYAADRLLDARPLGSGALGTRPLEGRPVLGGLPPDSRRPNTDTSQPHTHRLEARHLFHHRHRPGYLGGILVAALTLSSLAPRLLPSALHLYLVEGALLVAWFLVLHATPFARPLPKEFVVGIFFAAAAFIPTVARRPELRLALAPSALLFAALCTLNGLFIHAWEDSNDAPPANLLTRLCAARLSQLTGLTALLAATRALLGPRTLSAIPIACCLAALLLLALHTTRHRFNRTTLRAAADFVLLTPLILLLVQNLPQFVLHFQR